MAEKKTRETAHVSLARQLGTAIVTGVHAPGQTIPGELELATISGVSRSVVRESLRTLAAKGLIVSRRKAGTLVRPRTDWNMLDPELLQWTFEGAPPLDFVRMLFELRLIVEPGAAQLAAAKRTGQQLSRMGHALETMMAHGLETEAGRAADQLFHAVLLEATHNDLLVNLSASIGAAVRWTTFFKYRAGRVDRDPMPQHRRVFDAIADGDEATARAETATLVRQALSDTEAALKG